MARVIIIGGGVFGLRCALALLDTYRARGGTITHPQAAPERPGLRVSVWEAREQPGGRMVSEHHEPYTVELGPTTIPDTTPGFLELVSRVGLQSALLTSDERGARAQLFRKGKLRRLPTRTAELFLSDALSPSARLRLLAAPLLGPEAAGPSEESVAAFFRRRLGDAATNDLIEPIVAELCKGDLEALSLKSTLPELARREAEAGGLFAALLQHAQLKPPARLCGFRGGLGSLATALARTIGEAGGEVCLGTPAVGLSRLATGYAVASPQRIERAEAVVLATSASSLSRLFSELDPTLSELSAPIDTVPLVCLTLAWPREQIPQPLDGAGFLVPRTEGLRLLAVRFLSSTLPDFEQAPRGQAVLRAEYGGARDRELVLLDDGELLLQVRRDLKQTLGIMAEPRFIHIKRWPQAIEQYTLGHAERAAELTSRLKTLPGLHIGGTVLDGASSPKERFLRSRELGLRIAYQLRLRDEPQAPELATGR
jgi:oxygen-dependent protoporphyrinogen oxidase